MPVFKAALRLIYRSPLYLLLYIVLFGLLGILIVSASGGSFSSNAQQTEYVEVLPKVAIVDRDNSALSEGYQSFIADHATLVELEDTTLALQDATALNLASYIAIIPAGFGEDFVAAVRSGDEPPALEVVVNYAESSAVLTELVTNEYFQAVRIAALGAPEASEADLVELAAEATAHSASIKMASVEESSGASSLSIFYFQWMAYPITTGLIVLTGSIFAAFQSGELRRRNLCAPMSPFKMNAQVAVGCISLVLMTWLFLMILALLPVSGGWEVFTANPATFGLMALAALVYALAPFAIGFMLSQLGMKEMALNGAANIISLTFCFISGVFMGSAAALGEGVQAIAHFTPTYWYSEALLGLGQAGLTTETLTPYFEKLGIMLLFVVLFLVLAFIAGKVRSGRSESDGNAAADAVV